jgi:general secretion pathway protein M
VTIESARPQALFGWVASLERRGLAVERLRAQANADRTLTAEIAFRARGS